MHSARGLVAATVAAVTAVVSLTAAPAGHEASAAPADDLRARAAALQDEIEANGMRSAALGEELNGARLRLDEAKATIADAERRIAANEQQVAVLQERVDDRAAALYKAAGSRGGLEIVEVEDGVELSARMKYASVAADSDDRLLDRLATAKDELGAQRADAEERRGAAAAERDRIEAVKREIDDATARQEALLAQVEGDLATLVAQEQARREAAALEAARARVPDPDAPAGGAAASGSGVEAPVPMPGPVAAPGPAASGGAAAAVAYALAQVGKPYQYAAAGPDRFDCSGLTMMAWRQGGVSMPHFSGAQFAMFPKVPLSELQPGDLVFPSDPNAHVGMYAGGGMMVAATRTGDFVRHYPLYDGIVQAVRPG